jgi:hypothetical protein
MFISISTATWQSPSLNPCDSTFGCICPCTSTAPVRLHKFILISIEIVFVASSIMCPLEVGGSRTVISKSWIFKLQRRGAPKEMLWDFALGLEPLSGLKLKNFHHHHHCCHHHMIPPRSMPPLSKDQSQDHVYAHVSSLHNPV